MADLVDKAESELSQIIARVATVTTQSSVKLSARIGKGVALAPLKAAVAMLRVTSAAISTAANPQQGKVSLKTFTQVTDGKRDVVQLDDKAVAREFERELKRHGVTWSVDQHPDGSRTFHVQGKDTELIQHALGVAAARVDEKIARGAPELQSQQPAPERDGYDEPVQGEGIAAHGTDELREDAPARSSAADATPQHDQPAATTERDEAVADRGAHSQQRETPVPAADRPPRQLSPRDETREKVAKRIEKEVKAKKEELSQKTTRTPNRKRGRDTATEAHKATKRR